MKPFSQVVVEVEDSISELEKIELEKSIKSEYGSNLEVKIKGRKIKNEAFEDGRVNVLNNNLKSVYENYLTENYPDVNLDSFFELDGEISNLIPDQNDGAKQFRVKRFAGKNILSFNEFEVELENRGILRIFSEPHNMGGKSNLIRSLKILLFGEFYRSNQEKTTLSTIVNRFSPLNIAYVEGEIEIENKTYFIRRDFTRNNNNKVSQRVTISCDGVMIDVAQFEKMIGKIKDFLFISFFDSFSIEKWLNTKPTERYRMFLNYFGLGNIEEKAKTAKKQYDIFLKNSIAKKYEGVDIDFEIVSLKNQINTLKRENANYQQDLNAKVLAKDSLKEEIKKLSNLLKGVPDSLLGETPESLEGLIKQNKATIETNEKTIINLENSIAVINSTSEELNAKIADLQNEISKVEADKSLLDDLQLQNYMLSNYVVPATRLSEKASIEKEIDNLRTEYISITSDKKNKEELLENTPDTVVCNLCNGVSDNKKKKAEITEQIAALIAKAEDVKQKGIQAKNNLTALENNIKGEEIDYKKEINKKIEELNTKIRENKSGKIEKIKSEILVFQNDLSKILNNEKIKANIRMIKSEINSLVTRNSELEERLKNISLFTNDLETNKKTNEQISIKELEIEDIQNEINNFNVKISINNDSLSKFQEQIDFYLENKDLISDELSKDKNYKIYIDVHSKGGLAMKILRDLADDINQDLRAVLSEDDFSPSIKIEDDAIEFYFERNGIEFNMSEGSGYEKTVLLLALHYLLLSKMVVPISNIFILDEVFVAVASPFLPRVYRVVEKLLNIFETVALITHNEEVAEWCNDNIKIIKNNNISKIVG